MLERILQAVAELEERFDGPTEHRDLLVALALFVATFALGAISAPGGLASADAAVYLQQIREADFASRPTHVGYYLFGWLWTSVVGDSDRALNWMSAAFGALAVSFVWLHSLRLSASRTAAAFAVAVVAAHALVVANALHAEVYMAEAALLLASLHLWLRGSAPAAGVLLALAALVTPSAVFVTPAFVLLRPRPRPLVVLAAVAGIGVALGVAPLGAHYFSGGRGLLSGASAHLGLFGGLKKEGMEVVLGAAATLPWIATGALLWCARSWLRPWVLALAVAWGVGFALGERFGDVPVQLPLHLWACCLVAVALAELPDVASALSEPRRAVLWGFMAALAAAPFALIFLFRGELQAAQALPPEAWLGSAVFVIAAALVCSLWRPSERGLKAFAAATLLATLVSTLGQSVATHRSVVAYRDAVTAAAASEPLAVGGWSPGILFEHYRYGRAYTGHWIDRRELDAAAAARLEGALGEGREVWLLDGPLPESLASVRERASSRERAPIEILRGR